MLGFGKKFTALNIDATICGIACGESHCLAYSSNGALYVWGNGDFGKLGGNKPGLQPQHVDLQGQQVVAIAGGSNHSVILVK